MTGRPPKPNRLKAAEGDRNKIGVRKLQERIENEPPARFGLPACPAYLKGHARRAWKFWVEELEIMGLDKRPDAIALEGACVNYGHAVEADELVAKNGVTLEMWEKDQESGQMVCLDSKENPALKISVRCWSLADRFIGNFGFTPVSRTRLSIEKSSKADDLAEMLMQPRLVKKTG